MAVTTANASSAFGPEQKTLFAELWALQNSILSGKRPQFTLSTTTIEQLKASVAANVSAFDAEYNSVREPELDETQRKRRRIERNLQEQSGKRRIERANTSKILDVDDVLVRAQTLIPPLSGLRVLEDKSSFDENDYYSSQVESEWSPEGAKTKAFTADFERFDTAVEPHADVTGGDELEDDYEPEEPDDALELPTPRDEPASDYEPGEVSQDDEYTPDYAPVPADSPRVQVQNQLTHLAAPQPNRVSPLAVQKNYELELVNGRPEMVRKAQYEIEARQSSASPPMKAKRKTKKRKREIEQQPKAKKRDRRMGLDTSAQYPTERRVGLDTSAQYTTIKEEPYSPQLYQRPQREDLRRVASLQAQSQFLEQPYTPIAMPPPPSYRPEPPPEELYMPVAPRRVVVDQYGNRYYTADESAPAPFIDRAPSRISQYEQERVSQYDPANARIEYAQPAYRPAATPAYGQDLRMPKVRQHPQFEQAYAPQPMAPPAPIYVDRQPSYAQAPPEYMPQAYAPRQGSVAPVQYHIRQAAPQLRPMSELPDVGQYRAMSVLPEMQPPPQQYFMPQEQLQYIDTRVPDLRPRQFTEYRPY